MNLTDDWKPLSGTFSLSPEGEQIHVYCEKANGEPNPLFSLTYTGSWTNPSEKSPPLGPNESYLPEGSEEFDLVLPRASNYQYVGPTANLTSDELKGNGTDPNNWEGSNSSRFEVGNGSSPASTLSIFASVATILSSVSVICLFL